MTTPPFSVLFFFSSLKPALITDSILLHPLTLLPAHIFTHSSTKVSQSNSLGVSDHAVDPLQDCIFRPNAEKNTQDVSR
jgi:hypothetical protein